MKALIVGLMLILAPPLAWAGDARMLFLAARTTYPVATGSTVYGFEDNTLQGWSGGAFAPTSTSPHAGTYSISGVSGYTQKAITPVSGTLTFWYRSLSTGTVKVDGNTVLALSDTGNVWTEASVAITGTVVRFDVTAGSMALDDISVPTP